MTFVVDASVAAMWVIPDRLRDRALRLLAGDHGLIAPMLLRLEIGQVVLRAVRRGLLDEAQAKEAVAIVDGAIAEFQPIGTQVDNAYRFAARFGGSIRDALYLSVARSLGVPVITNDLEMARIGRQAGIDLYLLADGLPPDA